MHGIMMNQLRLYSEAELGAGGWQQVCSSAGVPPDCYNISQSYPDEQTLAVIHALSEARGMPRSQLMEEFGQFIVPALVRIYGGLLSPEWQTLDILEHTEEVIHKVIRARSPGARPPRLEIHRVSPTEVQIVYVSSRKLCGLARGITRGIATHLGERLEIRDIQCMHWGDERCLISAATFSEGS